MRREKPWQVQVSLAVTLRKASRPPRRWRHVARDPSWQPTLDDPEVQAHILAEVGEEGVEMAKYLHENEPIGSVEILEHYEETKPSEVRKVLYRLMDAHVAEYEKDTDAQGWETFTWRMTLNEIKHVLLRRWADARLQVEKQIRFEKDHQFYACSAAHRRIVFEDAIDIGFHCPVCNEPMNEFDNQPVIEQLEEELDHLAA